MLDGLFAWLLLPLGLVLGWVLRARNAGAARPLAERGSVSAVQLGGLLHQLESDDPDQAIVALTQVGDLDPGAAELHLTLGKMFRKRGEVDRALRIHESLASRDGIAPELQAEARFELARDYHAAGVLDRAEELFQSLAEQGRYVTAALDAIRTIHEQAHDWRPAIEAARRLEAALGESQRAAIAQYYCELADEAQAAKQTDEAVKFAKRALDEEAGCVRARLQLGGLEMAAGRHAAAAKHYLKAFEQDPRFLADVIEPLQRCMAETKDREGYLQFLHDAREMSSSSLPFVAEARLLAEEGVDPLDRLAQGLEARPSRAVLAEFLEVLERQPDVIASGLDKPAASLRQALVRLMESSPRYQCSNCGFSPRQMFWQCPACKHWGTTAPADDVMRV